MIFSNPANSMLILHLQMHEETVERSEWGHRGGPWEFNLRDIFRWCELLIKNQVEMKLYVISVVLFFCIAFIAEEKNCSDGVYYLFF